VEIVKSNFIDQTTIAFKNLLRSYKRACAYGSAQENFTYKQTEPSDRCYFCMGGQFYREGASAPLCQCPLNMHPEQLKLSKPFYGYNPFYVIYCCR